jgi:hypothetical protein
MSNEAQSELIVAAYRLSRSAPQQWEEFERAYAAYTTERVEEAVQASPELAQTSHGRAQSLLALRKVFQELEARYKAIEKHKSR